MKIYRALPPAAAPIGPKDLAQGFVGLFSREKTLRDKLEGEIKEYFGVRSAWCVSSGKAALTLILLALKDLSTRKRVVIPAYTCFSVPSAVVKAGLEVALCDIDPATFDFDPRSLERCIDEKTLCVIPNHLFGVPSDLDSIAALCRSHGAYLVEDAAQAMGGMYKGKKIGTVGDAGFFSLGRGKNLTCGSGGIIVTSSSKLAPAIERLYSELASPGFFETAKEFLQLLLMAVFIRPILYWFPQSLPFLKLGETLFYREFPVKKLSGMKTRCLWNWPKRLQTANRARTTTAEYFRDRLRLQKSSIQPAIGYLRLPLTLDSRETRDRVYISSQTKGLGFSRMYPTPINEIEEIKGMFSGEAFPRAKEVAEKLVTLPTHHLVTEKDREAICALFRSLEIRGDARESRRESRRPAIGAMRK